MNITRMSRFGGEVSVISHFARAVPAFYLTAALLLATSAPGHDLFFDEIEIDNEQHAVLTLHGEDTGFVFVDATSDHEIWENVELVEKNAGPVVVKDDRAPLHHTRSYRATLFDDLVTAIHTPGILWVDAVEGENESALPGRQDRPYRTIQAALADLESGNMVYIYNGIYEVTPVITGHPGGNPKAPLVLSNLLDVAIIGLGNGVVIRGDGAGDFLSIEECENILIENLTFQGNRPSVGQPPPGLFAMLLLRKENRDVVVRNCRFLDFGNHGVSHLWGPKMSTFVTIEHCLFRNGGDDNVPNLNYDGAGISGIGSNWSVLNNTFEDCVRGIEIEGANVGFPSRNILIEGNRLVNSSDRAIMLFATNVPADYYTDIVIANNIVNNIAMPSRPGANAGITINGGKRISVQNNLISNIAGWGIAFTRGHLDDISIVGNHISNVGSGIVVWQQQTTPINNASIIGNLISGCTGRGIFVTGQNIIVSDNTIRDAGSAGIRIQNAAGDGTQKCIIKNNVSFDTRVPRQTEHGIYVASGVSGTLLMHNVVLDEDHSVSGIFDTGTGTRMIGNIID